VPVVLDVKFGCLAGVMSCVLMMPMRGVCVMGSDFVVSRLMVLGRFAMMSRRVLVMLRCFVMMLCGLFRHSSSVWKSRTAARKLAGIRECRVNEQ
jgi:hypothetical protein